MSKGIKVQVPPLASPNLFGLLSETIVHLLHCKFGSRCGGISDRGVIKVPWTPRGRNETVGVNDGETLLQKLELRLVSNLECGRPTVPRS